MEDPIKDIEYVVLSVISKLKELGASRADEVWLLNEAISFYTEKLKGFEAPSLVSEEMEINLENRVWSIPSHCFAITRVAYKSGNRLWTLTIDNSIDLSGDMGLCDPPTPPQDNNVFLAPEWWYGNVTRYGQGGGVNVNYYRYDPVRRRIIFSEALPIGKGVVEYLSAGKEISKSTLVPPAYLDTFKNYLVWQYMEFSADEKLYRRAKDRERIYRDSMWESNTLEKGNSITEYLDSLYMGSGLTLR